MELINPESEVAIREINQNDSDFWIKFNPNTLNIYGDPTKDDIAVTDIGYFQEFTLRVNVTDSLG